MDAITHQTETVAIDDLRPHPRNYREHPDGQVEHLVASLEEHGFYRNVVIARDGTILAGHGIVEAAKRVGWTEIPVVRLDVDPTDTRALKILTGDNELGRFADTDDRKLTELLRKIGEQDLTGLLGTGYDQQMLANLAMITRPASEIADADQAAEWVGLPGFEAGSAPAKVVVSFDSEEDRDRFLEMIGVAVVHKKTHGVISIWWPERQREDLSSLRFE